MKLLNVAARVAATALFAVLFLGPVHADPVTTVRIATTGYVVNGKLSVGGSGATARVAKEGWLAAQLKAKGIALDWMTVAGDTGPTINEAFASRRIQFATYGDLPSLILNAAGVRTQMITPLGRGSDMWLLVPVNSTAKSILDLKGKRISLHHSRPWELGFYKMLARYGLKKSDFHIVNMDPRTGVVALASGQVDALFSNNGDLYQSRKLGKIIWSTRGSDLDFKMRAEVWGARDFIDAHPDIAQLVATAFVRAQYYVSQDANKEGVIQDGTFGGTPAEIVRDRFADPRIPWKYYWTPLYDPLLIHQYQQSAQFAFDSNTINKKLDVKELLNPRFTNAALASLHLQNYWKPWQGNTAPAP